MSKAATPADHELELLGRLIGSWSTEATHPMMPGLVVRGTVDFEWLEGGHFLIQRGRTDHPDFPDSLSVIGRTENDRVDESTGALTNGDTRAPLHMHYYDSRGVYRLFDVSVDETSWRVSRLVPGFSQRGVVTWAEDGDSMVGQWELRRDDVNWVNDLAMTYRRA